MPVSSPQMFRTARLTLKFRADSILQVNASSLVRCLPGEDATNGFFVSCFVKESAVEKRKTVSDDVVGECNTGARKKRKT